MIVHRGHTRAHDHVDGSAGIALDRGWRYDLELWFADRFLLGGSLALLRRRVIDLARLERGGAVLDVGCGTGTLTLEIADRVGPDGFAAGIDLAPRQIETARRKAARRGLKAEFRVGSIGRLPFPEGSFGAVTSTLMLHHLPDDVRRAGLGEALRVLQPAGRLVVADFVAAASRSAGTDEFSAVEELVAATGFIDIERDALRFRRVHAGYGGVALLGASKPTE